MILLTSILRDLCYNLVLGLQCRVVVVLYPLSPNHTYKNTFPYVVQTCKDIYNDFAERKYYINGGLCRSGNFRYHSLAFKERKDQKTDTNSRAVTVHGFGNEKLGRD